MRGLRRVIVLGGASILALMAVLWVVILPASVGIAPGPEDGQVPWRLVIMVVIGALAYVGAVLATLRLRRRAEAHGRLGRSTVTDEEPSRETARSPADQALPPHATPRTHRKSPPAKTPTEEVERGTPLPVGQPTRSGGRNGDQGERKLRRSMRPYAPAFDETPEPRRMLGHGEMGPPTNGSSDKLQPHETPAPAGGEPARSSGTQPRGGPVGPSLEEALVGAAIRRVWAADPDVERSAVGVLGDTVSAVEQRGRHTFVHFSNPGLVLHTKTGLGGSWRLLRKGVPLGDETRWVRLLLETDSWTAACSAAQVCEVITGQEAQAKLGDP